MADTLQNVGLILLFIVIGGVFAAAEMALVSLRDSQIKGLAGKGKRGQTVVRLAEDPNLFLSAVQIGVTLFGFLSASFGGATLADELSPVFVGWGVPESVASPLALVVITLVISYFSIVIGELTAKRLAMQRAEAFAMGLAPMVSVIATVARPIIWFLGVSTDVLVRLLGGDPKASREEVTDEELRTMVGQSQTLGDEERQIMDEVFAAGEVSLREAMVPRTEVDFLDGDLPAYKVLNEVRSGTHSRYPVTGATTDDILGFVHVRDLFDLDPATRNTPVGQLVRPILALPQSMRVLLALTQMRKQGSHLAVVKDEYGGTAGIVSLEDLVEELVGDITDEYDAVDATGPLEANDLDGLMTLEEFAERTRLILEEGPYDTIAGYLMARIGRLPSVGDAIEVDLPVVDSSERVRVEMTVTALDGRRAARLLVRRIAPGTADDVPS
ncbi:hemolysin family protein [Propionicicella superfundia]|uniref:hemolysin family protein n=1 Tax=Propionicicella superfundia TaxID=348582 RepID=UPI00041FEFD5|nr:hemolysin family protein [Propionicicella superfundia]